MAKATRIKRPVIPVPKNLDEAAEFLAEIGEERRAIDSVQSDFNAEVDMLKSKAIAETKPHENKISQLVEGLFAYAEAHRDELTENGKRKTIEVPTGIFGWRITPPAVSLHNIKTILKNLKSLGLERFIRTREEIDKEALLKESEVAKTIKGVFITQREEFIVKPAELAVEITTSADKLRKAAS